MTPIKTDIATHYLWRNIIIAIVCAGLAVWGWYDLTVTIPRDQETYETFTRLVTERQELEETVNSGRMLTPEQRSRYEELGTMLDATEPPVPPSTFDEYFQWAYISLILMVPWCAWTILRLKKNQYLLDENGALHLPDGEVWSREQIAGIDMSRWMAKSIAFVEHTDGRRIKLDAYLHKHMEKVIGHIAHRFDPDQWNLDGTRVGGPEGADDHEVDDDVTTIAAAADAAEDAADAASHSDRDEARSL